MIVEYSSELEPQFKEILESLRLTDGEEYEESYYNFDLHLKTYLKPPYKCWCYLEGFRLAGYIIGFPKSPHIYEIFNMYVLPQYRGKHIGSKLLDELVNYAYEETTSQLIASNISATNLPSRKIHTGWIEDASYDGWSRFYYIL